MHAESFETKSCVNCGTPTSDRYCPACGEKRLHPHQYALAHLAEETVDEFTHFDTKIFRSLWLLLKRPGFLTTEFLRGRRVPYMRPLQLFIVVNVLYFFTQPISAYRTFEGPLRYHLELQSYSDEFARPLVENQLRGKTETERAAFEEQFDRSVHTYAKTLIFLGIPLFTLLFAGLFWTRKRYFAEYFFAAIHFWTMAILLLIVLGIGMAGLIALLRAVGVGAFPRWFVWLNEQGPTFVIGAYAYQTIRQVYGQARWLSALKAVLIGYLWIPIVVLIRYLIFLITVYSL